MRLHENDCFATRHEKQYALGGHKKTPSAAKCSEGAAADKKERDIRPRYCTAPSRVFSSK